MPELSRLQKQGLALPIKPINLGSWEIKDQYEVAAGAKQITSDVCYGAGGMLMTGKAAFCEIITVKKPGFRR